MKQASKSRFLPATWLLYATAVYAVTSIVYFVAPIRDRFSSVFLGTTPFPHDTVLNAGILEWDFRALFDSHLSVFEWTAGFPLTHTLAGVENLLGWQIFYAPVRAAGLSVAGSYNVVWLLSILISGVGTALLARRLGASEVGAVVAGFVFAFYPLHIDHAIHLQTMSVCWSPFALLGLEMTLGEKGLRGPAVLAGSFIMTALCGLYFAVFLPVVLLLYAIASLLLGRYRFQWSVAGRIGLAALAAVVVLSPVLVQYLRFSSVFGGYSHPAEMLVKFSFPVSGLLRTPNWLAVWQHTPLATVASHTGAFPGIIAVCLVFLSFGLRGRDRGEMRIVILLIVLTSIAFLLALGPVLTLHTGIPYGNRIQRLPLPGRIWLAFTAIRWPTRMMLYAALFASVLAGLGMNYLLLRVNARRRVIAAIVFVLLWIEVRPATWYATSSLSLGDPIDISDAYPFIAREHDRGGVVELPSRLPGGYATPYATRYAYASAGHMRRVTAFHGSVLPAVLDSLRKASFNLPDAAARELFVSHGVTRLIVHKELYPGDSGEVLVRSFVAQKYPLLFNTKQSAVLSLGR